jgi:hypothetical protein
MTTATDQLVEHARQLIREAGGDIGVALATLAQRLDEVERRLDELVEQQRRKGR